MSYIRQFAVIFSCILLPCLLRAQDTELVFTADQNSNTLSIVDSEKGVFIGKISLGYTRSDERVFSPLYNGDINVHGINYDPVNHVLAVVSTVSNSVSLINPDSAQLIKRVNIGRNPHEPRFTKDGKELWVTVRGENYISILDALTLQEKDKIMLSEGPGMVTFSVDGSKAYVCSSFDDNFWILDVQSRRVLKTLKVPSVFSPFTNTTPDGNEVWVTHKDVGKVTRIDTNSQQIIETFETGKITNHVAFCNDLYFVSVGGEDKVKVYRLNEKNRVTLVWEIDTPDMPHGIWASAQHSQVYVVAELSNQMYILDARRLEITKTIEIGMAPQALIPVTLAGKPEDMVKHIEQHKLRFKGNPF